MTFPTAFPAPQLPDPGSVPVLRWGVVGPGGIAGAFTRTVQKHTPQRFVAVGSRSPERAEDFASRHRIEHAYGSYEAVLTHPEVDVVYIATPHHIHHELALAAIAAGKHVLIEKPITLTAPEARAVTAAARAAGVLAMEAMWTRYLPQMSVVRSLLADGALGDIHLVAADHGQKLTHVPRLVEPSLGGGSLLDLGVYPVSFAMAVLGPHARMHVEGFRYATGVDAQSVLTLSYASGAQAELSTTLLARTPTTASVAGSEALLRLEGNFYTPTRLVLAPPGSGTAMLWEDGTGILAHEGLCYQATALAAYVAEGRLESPIHTHEETVGVMAVLDEARHQLGYRFPGE